MMCFNYFYSEAKFPKIDRDLARARKDKQEGIQQRDMHDALQLGVIRSSTERDSLTKF
jgi:hypothetical protein